MKTALRISNIRRVLLTEWDPIGIRDEPLAQDEYDAYARRIATMLSSGASVSELMDYLTNAEKEMMGLVPDRSRAEIAAGKLCSLKET